MSEEETIQELSKINRMFASECDYLKNKLRKKENIIKEVREYIEEELKYRDVNKKFKSLGINIDDYVKGQFVAFKHVLEILDKEKE